MTGSPPPSRAVVDGEVCRVLGYRGRGLFVIKRKNHNKTEVLHREQLKFIKEHDEQKEVKEGPGDRAGSVLRDHDALVQRLGG